MVLVTGFRYRSAFQPQTPLEGGLYMGVVKSEVDADVCAHNMARGLAAKYRAE